MSTIKIINELPKLSEAERRTAREKVASALAKRLSI